MTANNTLSISELDYNDIRTNLKAFLRGREEFQDFDFEGSGMAILLDLLAYNTHYMAYHLNMVGNEMFLDSAQLRPSVVSHAKLMNYVPTSRRGSNVTVNIVVTPGSSEDNDVTTAVIDRGTKFLSDPVDGISYNFVTTSSNTATKSNGSFSFANVTLTQGEYISTSWTVVAENDLRQYVIPSANVDSSTLEITVQESIGNTYTETYTLADDITELRSNSKVYFLEELPSSNGSYMFYFGDGVLGKRPTDGNIVIATYLDTAGAPANKANGFILSDSIDGFSANVTVTPIARSSGGSDKETIEQIRFRSPYFYTAQNRMVTKNDYRSLMTHDYPNIQSIAIWGGEENDEPVYGKVFVSINPVDNYVISEDEKLHIINDVIKSRSILTVIPELVDPDYLYLLINATVEYDDALTSLTKEELSQLVRESIENYREEYLNKFNTTFRMSRLESILNLLENSFLGCETTLVCQKRVEITEGVTKTYTVDFGVPLYKGLLNSGLYSYPSVQMLDNDGVERDVFFEEVPLSFTGIDSIEVTNTGSGYTTTPTVTITGDGTGATATAKIVNGRVESITVTNRGSGYSRATVTITGNATASAILESNNGTLRSFYFKSNGEKSIISDSIGSINYNTGRIILENVKINSLTENDFYESNILTLNIRPKEKLLTPKRNQILTLDVNDNLAIRITLRKKATD